MYGWIKLYRELLHKPIWTDSTPEQKTILITLLLMANHERREWEWKGEKYEALPGQFVTSLPRIAEKAGKQITIQKVRTALVRFKKYEFLTDESTNRNRLITIVNWESYQGQYRLKTGKKADKQQADNRQLTTNKKERRKEGKNNTLKKRHENKKNQITKIKNHVYTYNLGF
ncbi:hypothetical protein [Cerasibacillus terrae]|uniref:hypothetical protein n=1 Tax=Cerasibacillus terrae TaxID=2498845 RepID=UPI0017466725|nr:hypothetical protein [Cerasibacillus terrae]